MSDHDNEKPSNEKLNDHSKSVDHDFSETADSQRSDIHENKNAPADSDTNPQPMHASRREVDVQPEHFHTQLSDEVKFRDYLMSHVTDIIEEKLERRIRKVGMFIQTIAFTFVVLLAPSAWFAINNLISKAISKQTDLIEKKIIENNAMIAKSQQQIVDKIQVETMYLTAANYATFLNQNSVLSEDELNSLIKTLQDLSSHKEVINRPGFILVLTNISDSLIKFGYGSLLQEIQKKYQSIVAKSPDLSAIFLHYYGRRILSTSNTENLRDTPLFQSYMQNRFNLTENNHEYLSLPFDTLISFHLADEVRNATTTHTIASANALTIDQKAYFIWDLLSQSDPNFFRENPAPSDFIVAQVANKLLIEYKDEINALALTNGVKESVLQRYQSARDAQEKSVGKYILTTIYHIDIKN